MSRAHGLSAVLSQSIFTLTANPILSYPPISRILSHPILSSHFTLLHIPSSSIPTHPILALLISILVFISYKSTYRLNIRSNKKSIHNQSPFLSTIYPHSNIWHFITILSSPYIFIHILSQSIDNLPSLCYSQYRQYYNYIIYPKTSIFLYFIQETPILLGFINALGPNGCYTIPSYIYCTHCVLI